VLARGKQLHTLRTRVGKYVQQAWMQSMSQENVRRNNFQHE
jgi:hypothetical protein